MAVMFYNAKVANLSKPQVVEDAFRAYFSFAGIHDFKFKTLYDTNTTTGWTAPTGGSVTVTAGSKVAITAQNSATLWTGYHDTVVPRQLAIKWSATARGTAVALGVPVTGSTEHYIIGLDASGYPFVAKGTKTSGSITNVLTLSDRAYPAASDMVAAFREISFDSSFNEWWIAVSLWVNGAHAVTHIEKISAVPATDYTFGITAPANTTKDYVGLSIPQLTNFIEWNSLDPGEFPIGGLQRALEGRYTKMFIRYDGTVYAWRPVTRSADMTIASADVLPPTQLRKDRRQLFSHIRMVGAYQEAEYARTDLGRTRFIELKNPMLMTPSECYVEAQSMSRRMEEESETAQYQIKSVLPLLEPEDRVTTDDGDFIVSGISASFSLGGDNYGISCRKYVEGV